MNKHFLLLLPVLSQAVRLDEGEASFFSVKPDSPKGCNATCQVAVDPNKKTACVHCCIPPKCNVDLATADDTPYKALTFYMGLAKSAQTKLGGKDLKKRFEEKMPKQITCMNPGTKSWDSALKKLDERIGGRARQMGDLSRASVVIHKKDQFTVANVDNLLKCMKDEGFSAVGPVQNRGMFPSGHSGKLETREMSGGYVDVKGTFMFGGEIQSEVQFILCHVWNYKMGRGHVLYEQARVLKGMRAEKDLNATEKVAYDGWNTEAATGYGLALANTNTCIPTTPHSSLLETDSRDAFMEYLYPDDE